MDFSILNEYFVVIVVLACCCVGYLIKHASLFKFIKNDNIPVVLAVVGMIVNCLKNGLSVDNVVLGVFMGLASTGLHQAFKQHIEQPKAKTKSKTK